MAKREPKWVDIGTCGLSCKLCPSHHTDGKSRCPGCKSDYRMGYWCPISSCGWKKRGLEFCWECDEAPNCRKWAKFRRHGLSHDSHKSYMDLEHNIKVATTKGMKSLEKEHKAREKALVRMLKGFNEGRSKSFYCVAATVLPLADIESALRDAAKASKGMDMKEKARALHGALEARAKRRKLSLLLRK